MSQAGGPWAAAAAVRHVHGAVHSTAPRRSRAGSWFLAMAFLFTLLAPGQLAPPPTLAAGDPPVAQNQDESTREAAPLSIFLDATDPEFDDLSYEIVTGPEHGSLDNCSFGFCTYTPDTGPNYVGLDTFTWRANDGTSDSNIATFTIDVTANQAPVATDQSLSTREGIQLFIFLDAYDNDAGDSLTFTVLTDPEHGTLDDCGFGSCTYTPNSDYVGPDSFTWRATDDLGAESAVATLSISVTANEPPVAFDQAETVRSGIGATLFLSASDPDIDDLTYTITDPPDHGTLTDCSGGFCTYTSDAGYAGADGFAWTANDGLADSNVATFSLTVVENSAPVATDGSSFVFTDTPTALALAASDADDDSLTFTVLTDPAHGTLDDCTDGSCVYTPAVGYTGTDSFTWRANDGLADSNIASTTLTVEDPLGQVLVLEPTVTGGTSSREVAAAAAEGYAADVVNADTWAAMTATEFDAYAALVMGDPTCGSIDAIAAAETNRAIWSSVVDGNIVVIGTDPIFHEEQGGGQLTDRAIAYVLASTGATGLYVTLSCYYDGATDNTPVDLLDELGSFEVGHADCYNDAHIVAEHPALEGLDDVDLSGWSCSVHEVFQTWPLSYVVLAIAEDFGAVYTAPDGSVGSPYILAAGQITVASDIDLSPLSATNPVGSSHELTATVSNEGGPIVGTTVTFEVIDGPHLGTTGTDDTDAAGVATFSYLGTAPGTDTIKATFVDGESRIQTSNLVTKEWVPNSPPNAAAGGPYAGAEGDDIALDGTATDPDASDALTTTWTYAPAANVDAGAACAFGDASAVDTTVSCTDDGDYTLALTVSDGVNPDVVDTASLTLANATPTVDISAPSAGSDHGVGQTVNLTAAVGDAGVNDTLTCVVEWGDGTGDTGTLSEAGVCTASHAYAAAGAYTITVTISDDDEADASDTVAITVTAAPTFTLDVTLAGDGSGSVSSDPAGIACPEDCSEDYLEGTSVTLTATPDTGSSFAGWSGGGCTGTSTCVVTMDAARSVTATFDVADTTLTVNTTSDTDDGACTIVHCSLREAINAANALAGPNEIDFEIVEDGPPHSIRPTTVLPTVTQPTVIDATTDSDYVGTPVIELDGSLVTTVSPAAVGLRITGGDSVVRGLAINRFGNPSSVSGASGIVLQTGGGNLIESNYLGTDITGQLDRGNGHFGVAIQLSSNNVIGGITPAARNVLSGNEGDGVGISGNAGVATGNQIIGNYIGLAADGSTALGNGTDGVSISQAAGNVVGGPTAGERNVISANLAAGVHLGGTGSQDNIIQGNLIGTDASGTVNRGNFRGVFFTAGAFDATIGGETPGAGNMIAYNFETGVLVNDDGITRSVRVRIQGNSIHSNGVPGLTGLGIDLLPEAGVTSNDTGDADLGGNRKMNFPVISSAQSGATPQVTGTLNSEANEDFRIEFFANPTCDTNGHGEGQLFLGALSSVLTDASGNSGPFTFNGTVPMPTGWVVTATSMEKTFGNTSEFSACANTDVSHTLTTTMAGDGSGSVSSDPAGIDCPGDCAEDYAEGTVVTLTATPDTGSTFTGWSGDCTGTASCVVTMEAARSVTATFDLDAATLTVNTTADTDDGACTVSHCSLREAMLSANAIVGTDTITFAIPGDGPHVISPASALPTIVDPVVIDGTSEPGFIDCGSGVMVEIDGSGAGTAPGLNVTAGGTTIRGLAVNGFDAGPNQPGIRLATGGGNVVECSLIGTDATGTTARPNVWGVLIFSSASNRIGGADVGNVISGNSNIGLEIEGAAAGSGNTVLGNRIGLDITGTQSLGNGAWGIGLFTPSNTIGGSGPGEGNTIAGNEFVGISLRSDGNSIVGNRVGTDVEGLSAIPNWIGIEVWGDGNTIGGSGALGNLISGNELDAIIVRSTASSTLIEGNLIGLDATGGAALANRMGVWLDDSATNVIGGTTAGAGNVISGNQSLGIFIEGSGATDNAIQGNLIGTDTTGANGLPNNGGIGIEAGANGNDIGGTAAGAGNVIAHNLSGVFVSGATSTGNAIISNAIHSNLGMGIDLLGTSGVTANDAGDADSGPNDLQNFPVLAAAITDGSTTTIEGTLNSTPDTSLTVQFFSNGECDTSGFGEGESLLGSLIVTTDGAGDAAFSATLDATDLGDQISATATNPGGSTSEFSACETVTGPVVIHTLDVTLAGDGSGSVSSDPAGIDCPEDCSEDYLEGASVTLTATPASGSSFAGWSGDCTGTGTCVVTMDAARSVTATFTLDPEPTADLSVSKTDEPDPVTAGNAVNYVITVTNAGPDAATNIWLVDTLPSGTTFLSADHPGCAFAGTTVSCALGTLAAEASISVSIAVRAPAVGSTTVMTNSATVSATEDDPDTSDNTSTATTTVEPAPDDPNTAAGWITAAGGTVTTGAGKPPSKQDPMTTSVTVPPGFPGVVTIVEGPITDCATGYRCFGQEANITAPTTTAATPLRLTFLYHSSSLPPSTQLHEVVMFHDDALVERCTGPVGVAQPDPCISSVARVKGSIQIIVFSSENGSWRGGR